MNFKHYYLNKIIYTGIALLSMQIESVDAVDGADTGYTLRNRTQSRKVKTPSSQSDDNNVQPNNTADEASKRKNDFNFLFNARAYPSVTAFVSLLPQVEKYKGYSESGLLWNIGYGGLGTLTAFKRLLIDNDEKDFTSRFHSSTVSSLFIGSCLHLLNVVQETSQVQNFIKGVLYVSCAENLVFGFLPQNIQDSYGPEYSRFKANLYPSFLNVVGLSNFNYMLTSNLWNVPFALTGGLDGFLRMEKDENLLQKIPYSVTITTINIILSGFYAAENWDNWGKSTSELSQGAFYGIIALSLANTYLNHIDKRSWFVSIREAAHNSPLCTGFYHGFWGCLGYKTR